MSAFLHAVEYYLPAKELTNEDLVRENPGWDSEQIYRKTGVRSRRVASNDETASDLGYRAASLLLEKADFDRNHIDALLFCTESPDYFLPPSACLLHDRLGLSADCGAFDYNLACSGFTYGLWLAESLIASSAARNVLLIVADTYSKYCDIHDLTTVTIFGDAGAAALISQDGSDALAEIGPSVVGTDGRGAEHLIVRNGAARNPCLDPYTRLKSSSSDERSEGDFLHMNGPEVFGFALKRVQECVERLRNKGGAAWAPIDWFLMHQANRFMLEHLRKKLKVAEDRLPIDVEDVGNTVSASIPVLLRRCHDRSLFRPNECCALVGFGVGYSWAASLLRWCESC